MRRKIALSIHTATEANNLQVFDGEIISSFFFFLVRVFLCSHYRLTRCHNFQFEKHVCEILSRPFHYSSFSRVVSAHNGEVFSNKTILCRIVAEQFSFKNHASFCRSTATIIKLIRKGVSKTPTRVRGRGRGQGSRLTNFSLVAQWLVRIFDFTSQNKFSLARLFFFCIISHCVQCVQFLAQLSTVNMFLCNLRSEELEC